VIGYAEILEEEVRNKGHRQDAGRIRDAARELLGVINKLLALSKIDAGAADPDAALAGAPRILVVDADAAVRDVIVHTAARLGFSSVVVGAGEADARAGDVDPALIVLNLDTPCAIDTLRGLRGAHDAPILAVQARDNRLGAIQAGAAACLDAPVARDTLAAAIARYARPRTDVARQQKAPETPRTRRKRTKS